MRNWRISLFLTLICAPAVLLVSFGTAMVLQEVPRAIRNEPGRIGREYREIAEDFMAHPERATYVGARLKGWRQVSKINGVPWGYERDVDGRGRLARVWFKSGADEWRAIVVGAIRPFPYALVFYGGGALVVLSLIGLTLLACVCLVRYVKSRDDFLAAAAHDLTTPLVGMRMMIGRDDEETRRLNERMLLIVSNIKDFLKLGGKRRKPDLKPVDVVALTHEAYRLFAADYEGLKSGAVEFAVSGRGDEMPPTRLMALADETMLLQILWNLFGNDLKYAAPYGKVSVTLDVRGDKVAVTFADEGPGLTPTQRRKAFDRYYRARAARASGKGGFGIGLCTAREFARAMGGDLVVETNGRRGCRFRLALSRA